MEIRELFQTNRLFAAIASVSFIGILVLSLITMQLLLKTSSNETSSRNAGYVYFEGSMVANDAGKSHGGFEWAASYIVRWKISKESHDGVLNITLDVGLGSFFPDGVDSIELNVANFVINDSYVSFTCWNGIQEKLFLVKMQFTEIDTIWNGENNNQYIAIQSSEQLEIHGLIDASMIPGFIEWFYIELRLHPSAELLLLA